MNYKDIRLSLEMTKTELAKKCGVSLNTIDKWENEVQTPTEENKKKFKYKDGLEIKKEILNQSFEDMTLKSYQVFTLFVEYLILNFGEKNILRLIKCLEQEEKLNDILQKIYNKSFEELIEDGNRYHKIIRN